MKKGKHFLHTSNFKRYKENFIHLLKTSYIEVVALGTIGLGIMGYDAHTHEVRRNQVIETNFPEISQILKDAKRDGREVSELNILLPKVMAMGSKVFETYNIANTFMGGFSKNWARELDFKMNLKGQYRYNLRDLIHDIPEHSQNVLVEKQNFVRARDISEKILDLSEYAYTHTPKHNTTLVLVTSIDMEGDLTTKLESKYVNTDHTFTYRPQDGNKILELGEEYVSQIESLELEKIYTASKTNAEGEFANEKSRAFDGKKFYEADEFQEMADTWFRGSTVLKSADQIKALNETVSKRIADWKNKIVTAKDTTYTTTEKTDPGPAEYRSMQAVNSIAKPLYDNTNDFVTSLEHTRDNVAQLEEMLDNYINDVFLPSRGKSKQEIKQAEQEILDLTKDTMRTTFKDGFTHQDYRTWYVGMMGLIGLVGFGLVGTGIHVLGEKTGIYDGKGLKRKKQKKSYRNYR